MCRSTTTNVCHGDTYTLDQLLRNFTRVARFFLSIMFNLYITLQYHICKVKTLKKKKSFLTFHPFFYNFEEGTDILITRVSSAFVYAVPDSSRSSSHKETPPQNPT